MQENKIDYTPHPKIGTIDIKGRSFVTIIGHIIDVKRLPESPVIVDAGVAKGGFTVGLKGIIKRKAKYILIEPSKQHTENLRKRYKADVFIDKALTGLKSPKEMRFLEFPKKMGWGSLKILHPRMQEVEETKSYQVKTTNLEAILKEAQIDRIDYLKLDIEGSELEVFQTMTRDVAAKIDQISMEVHEKEKRNYIIYKMKKLGFEVCDTYSELYAAREKA